MVFPSFAASPHLRPNHSAHGPYPAYDVVSIVRNKAGDPSEMGIESHEAIFTATNADLTNLLINAFDIKPDLIFGLPPWARSTRWNLQAKITDPDLPALKKLTKDQRRSMLAQVLADRFHLKTHTETKQLPVYNLVVTPHGPKFMPSAKQDADDMRGMSSSDSEVTLEAYPISALAYTLSSILHRTVIDNTGLTAHYDLHLTWAPERFAAVGQDDSRNSTDPGPSIFSAIQDQLGLKLIPAKGAVPTLVIDHVDLPTPN
jgi:bla regulator protein BlaR1